MKGLIKLSVLLVLLITPNVLFAHKSAEEKAKLVASKLNEKLVLTPDQLQKVTDIYTVHSELLSDNTNKIQNYCLAPN
jgi:hypothetical protein